MTEQVIVLACLLVTLVLFIWERWRYDLVALGALLFLTVLGIIPVTKAYSGFGHPAVITVVAVLVISRGLQNAGVVDVVADVIKKAGTSFIPQMAALIAVTLAISAVMNNVGAIAVLLPVAMELARESERPASLYLMPVAFASLLGGMTTMIGTPPNIIIANLRADISGEPFQMFDFTPVGLGVAVAGGIFLIFLGRYLLPEREAAASPEATFAIESYLTEFSVVEGCKAEGMTIKELEERSEIEVVVLGLIRHKKRILRPSRLEELRSGDILIVEADPEQIKGIIDYTGMELSADETLGKELITSSDVQLMEAIISPGSWLRGRTRAGASVQRRTGSTLLAVARRGQRLRERLNNIRLRVGDVLLLRGSEAELSEAVKDAGLLPLATRYLRLGIPRSVLEALVILGSALVCIAAKLLPVELALPIAAVSMVIAGLIPLRDVYTAVEWPVVILLGAMLPVGQSLESTGAAHTLSSLIVALVSDFPPVVALVVILLTTMFLSDVINNAAAAVLMAPLAVGVALGLQVSPDPFLMSVAIGASCAFLTPVGHQSNAIVMGPGGYLFGDYWKLGLPLELIVVVVGVPLLLFVWPL